MNQIAITKLNAQFSGVLRSWRKLRKLSQWELSMTAGISQRHLSFLESGRSSPSRETVLKLAGTLNPTVAGAKSATWQRGIRAHVSGGSAR